MMKLIILTGRLPISIPFQNRGKIPKGFWGVRNTLHSVCLKRFVRRTSLSFCSAIIPNGERIARRLPIYAYILSDIVRADWP